MADGLNNCQFIGNLGQDPEFKVTQSGQGVLKVRLAVSESYLDKSNTRQEKTEWVSCTIWGKRGEALAKILHKGDRVFVSGSMQTSSYEKNGEKRYSTEINVREVILCGGGKRNASQASDEGNRPPSREASRYGTSGHGASTKHTGTPEPADDFDNASDVGSGSDDIPFAIPSDVSPRHIRRRRLWERF